MSAFECTLKQHLVSYCNSPIGKHVFSTLVRELYFTSVQFVRCGHGLTDVHVEVNMYAYRRHVWLHRLQPFQRVTSSDLGSKELILTRWEGSTSTMGVR